MRFFPLCPLDGHTRAYLANLAVSSLAIAPTSKDITFHPTLSEPFVVVKSDLGKAKALIRHSSYPTNPTLQLATGDLQLRKFEMERAHQAQSHDLPISVPTPLVETTDVGNQEGKALASGSLRSEDEKHPYNNEAYVTDLEASRSPSEEQDKDQDSGGSLMNRFKSFRRSRAARVIWDFAWIALLVSSRVI